MIVSPDTLPAQVQQCMDDRTLSVQTPSLIHTVAATSKRLPSKMGKSLRMSRYSRLPTFPVPLGTSGAPIPSTPVSRTDIDATVSFYGQFIAVNQQVTLQNSDPVLNNFAELLGLSLRMTEDQLTRDCMASTASSYNCTGGNNGDLPTNISVSDFDEVTATLMSNDAWMILAKQEGVDKFGTAPARTAYLALGHSRLSKDLNNLANFLPQWNYPTSSKTLDSEWGAVNNVRILLSAVGSVDANASRLGNDVYNIFVQGLEAICIVEQDNYSARYLYRPAVYSDPLFQNVTIGTTFAQVPRVLNDLWITKMRCTLR